MPKVRWRDVATKVWHCSLKMWKKDVAILAENEMEGCGNQGLAMLAENIGEGRGNQGVAILA